MIRFSRSTGLISASGLLICALLFASVYTVSAESDFRLGTAGNFGVLAGSTVTNTGDSRVSTNVGVWPGEAATGWFPPGEYGGTLHLGDAVAQDAQTDLVTAYTTLAGLPCDVDLTDKDLGNQAAIDGPLVPGVYCFSSSAQLTGALVLDAQGLIDPLFVFQIGSTLTTAPNASVSFVNGTSSCNVYWQITSSATLDTGTSFTGNIVALTSISLLTGADISGRALARNGAVTMDTNTITNLSCSVTQAEPTPEEPTETPTDVTPTETAVPTATPVAPTATSVPPTATAVPAVPTTAPAISTTVPTTPTTVLPVATPLAPEATATAPATVAPGSQTEQPAASTSPTAVAPETATEAPSETIDEQVTGTGATAVPESVAGVSTTTTEATSTPVAQVPSVWPTSTSAPEATVIADVTFPKTGSQGPLGMQSNQSMSTLTLILSMTLVLLATGVLAVTVERRSRG